MNYLKKATLLVVVSIGILAMLGSQTPPRTESVDPSFTSFSLAPESVCLNIGIPLVQVNYEFDPGTWSNESTLCTTIKVNGSTIHPTVRHQCWDDGTVGTYTFNLTERFGSNVPPEIDVSVELTPSIAGEVYDTVAGTVKTSVSCPPAGGIPTP